jgi:topoisomerase-4 subunit B
MNQDNYGIDKIESLSFKDGVRLRIPMYLGTNDTDGIYQALKEVINNSTDEALMGFGDTININLNEETNEVSIQDYGRGIPFGLREDGENVLVSVFSKPHTGGKFNHKTYTMSSGLNGIGIKATCLSALDFTAIVQRDNRHAIVKFHKGDLIEYHEEDTIRLQMNGTLIKFIPDKEVFQNMEEPYTFDRICQEVENIAFLNKGIHFNVTCGNQQKHFYSKNGIADFIKNKVKKPLMKQPILASIKDSTDELEIAFMWTADPSQSYVFVNGLYCSEGGTPITGAKTSITQQVKRLSKKEFDPDVIRKGLVFAINCKVQEPSFANQTKSKINNPNLRSLASQAFKDGLERFARTPEFDVIINTLNKMQRAENAANKARQQVMETAREIEKNGSKKVFNSDKLKDAEKLGADSVLLLVEGDSAAGAMAQARDITRYGILALRGKILNPLSNSEERIAANDEITLLLKALNIVPGKYDSKKLRYGRVAICTDSDSDGFHIGLLVASVLHYIAPSFLLENRLCWLRSPLYIVTKNGREDYYFTDQEMDAARSTISGIIQRNKGLGSLSPDQAHRSMFTSEFQRMDVLEPTPEAIELLENLMGDDVEFRRQYIFDNIDFQEVRE